MSNPMEDANRIANEAAESLKRAEARVNSYLGGTLNLPPGVTYQELAAEVTRCTQVLAAAQKTVQALAAHNSVGNPNFSTLIGRVMKVCINQNKLMRKYLTPVGSNPSTPPEAPTTTDLSQLTLKLDYPMFYTNSSYRYCVVIDCRQSSLPLLSPSITIVLITDFNDKPLDEVLAQQDFSRVMPIRPTPVRPGTGTQLITTPEWMPHSKHKSPYYILCIPIQINLVQIEACDEDDTTLLDAANLEKLKLHLLSLGGLKANAEFVDSDEEESDDDGVEVSW